MMQFSYVLAVVSSIAYGAADFLGGLATKRSTVLAVVVSSQLTGLALVLLALPLLPATTAEPLDYAWGAASGLAGGVGLALLYRGLATGVMSVVAPVTAVCAVIIPVVAGLAFGERPSSMATAGIVLATVAIALVSQSEHPAGPTRSTGVPIAIAAGIAIGIFLVCQERTESSAGLWPLVAARIVSVGIFATAGLFRGQRLVPPRPALTIALTGGALDMVANILYLLAVRQGALSTVATLAS